MTKRGRWFLPEMPDVRGLLCAQVAVTRDGVEAFEAWSRGEPGAADRVRDAEHRGDVAKREVLTALRGAFVTDLEPEDLFSLSRGIDRILNYTRDLVNEAELLGAGDDPGLAEMAALLRVRSTTSMMRSRGSDPMRMARSPPPIRRSGMPASRSTSTTAAWPRCSSSRTGANGSRAASFTAAPSESARP